MSRRAEVATDVSGAGLRMTFMQTPARTETMPGGRLPAFKAIGVRTTDCWTGYASSRNARQCLPVARSLGIANSAVAVPTPGSMSRSTFARTARSAIDAGSHHFRDNSPFSGSHGRRHRNRKHQPWSPTWSDCSDDSGMLPVLAVKWKQPTPSPTTLRCRRAHGPLLSGTQRHVQIPRPVSAPALASAASAA